jgi:hypothetical protein
MGNVVDPVFVEKLYWLLCQFLYHGISRTALDELSHHVSIVTMSLVHYCYT